jgi:hypothetical protein
LGAGRAVPSSQMSKADRGNSVEDSLVMSKELPLHHPNGLP